MAALAGRTVVKPGGTRGIGRSIVYLLARPSGREPMPAQANDDRATARLWIESDRLIRAAVRRHDA